MSSEQQGVEKVYDYVCTKFIRSVYKYKVSRRCIYYKILFTLYIIEVGGASLI